ncbi:hypothetical protein N0B44_25380 [Roseibacterium beibuensis]|uniref:hypothetical protein n=1 Tax=[Roseibacterium] beibuensis TaxID=1193142 RepID=UPI00217D41AB|nr:hypothetical protein [Roseibacterium beibuensis]MCS6626256.1 hypothetical protein [Roseibacterium beibuensis]
MIALSFAAALLTVAPAQAAPPVLLPGVADLPILAGATPSPDCGGMIEMMGDEGRGMVCVGAPVRAVNDLVFAYKREAEARGWTDSGGAANALWVARRTADGGCERLTIVGFWDFRLTEQPDPNTPGYVGFQVQPVRICPAAVAQ